MHLVVARELFVSVTVHFAVSHYLTLILTPNPNPNHTPGYNPKP